MKKIRHLFYTYFDITVEESNNSQLEETDYINEAQNISKVIIEGINKKDYSGINESLSDIIHKNEEDKYIFTYPSNIIHYLIMLIASSLLLVFIYYLIIGSSTYYFSSTGNMKVIALFLISISVLIIGINLIVISKSISSVKYIFRFNRYKEFLSYKNIEYIQHISNATDIKEELVVKDLNKAIEDKVIPQGYFTNENLVFMVSNSSYHRYRDSKEGYDHYFKNIIESSDVIISSTAKIDGNFKKAERFILKYKKLSESIKDDYISKKIDEIINVVIVIFDEFEKNPKYYKNIGVLVEYYLPATEKLLVSYLDMEEKNLLGNAAGKTKKEIELAICTLLLAFEGVHKALYEEYEMHMFDDIRALDLSVKKERLPV